MRRRDGMAARDVAVRQVPFQARLLRRRSGRLSRSQLEALEAAGYEPLQSELLVALVWLVLDAVHIPENDLNATRRRAMFVLAAGGDPHRELDLNTVAAERLADELDSPERRKALHTGLSELDSSGLPAVSAGVCRASRRPGSRLALPRARAPRGRARRGIASRRNRPYTGTADVVSTSRAAVAISRPDPRRKRKLPRALPGGRRRLQPYSRADAPFFRSPGFFVRIGGLAVVVAVALCLLALRAWSIQILHGPAYTALANGQAYRTVDLIGPRGPIVDTKGRLLVGTTGHVVVVADVAALGEFDPQGWHPTTAGLVSLRRLSRLAHTPVSTFIVRIRRSVVRSPFAPAVVLPHPETALTGYLDERSDSYPGFTVTYLPSRSYAQGDFGSTFLGLLGEVSTAMLTSKRYAHARAGETVGVSGVEADVRPVPERRLRPRARARRLDGPRRRPAPARHAALAADAAADDRRAPPARRGQGGPSTASRSRTRNGHSDAQPARPSCMNPKTGAVYALVELSERTTRSPRPAIRSISRASTTTRRTRGLLNQATQGVYPTGSTFKPIVAEAALSEGIITPYDAAALHAARSRSAASRSTTSTPASIENMSLPTALAQSCDTWFYRLGDKFFGRGSQGIQQLGEAARARPSDRLRRPRRGARPRPDARAGSRRPQHTPWYEGQTINLSIGQGYLAGDAAPARGRVLRARERRHRRPPARREGDPPRRVGADAEVQARAQGEADRRLGDQAGALRGRALAPAGRRRRSSRTFPCGRRARPAPRSQAPDGSDHSWYASWAPGGRTRRSSSSS